MVRNKIAIGTAQFGMVYGITNSRGKIPASEVGDILERASAALTELIIDTSPRYGDSEQIIGRLLQERGLRATLVTKTPRSADQIISTFVASLDRLRVDKVYGVIDHNAQTLLSEDGDKAFKALDRLRKDRCVTKIGASVYNASQIETLLDRYSVDLIQVPLNILDQRLIDSGHLRRVKDRGLELHARSVFLQGVLLNPPPEVDSRLQRLGSPVRALHDAARARSLSPLQAALGFVLGRPEVDRAVIGVTSLAEFEEVLAAAAPLTIPFPRRFGLTDPDLLDPRSWPEAGSTEISTTASHISG